MDIVLKNVKKRDLPVIKSLSKSLGFEIEKESTSKSELAKQKPYNPEFVKMILEGQEEIRQGNYVKISMEELDNLWK